MRYTVWLLVMALNLHAVVAGASSVVAVNEEQVRSWNQFFQELVTLQQREHARYELRVEQRSGEYGGEMAKGYGFVERRYFDQASGTQVSLELRDRDHPDRLQRLEVAVLDADGAVTREYSATYLPWARNAPIVTTVNFHHRGGGVAAFRQFDASGALQYEQCNGQFAGRPVALSLEYPEIRPPVTQSAVYAHCFRTLPQGAGRLLRPQ